MSMLCPICSQPKQYKKVGDSIFIACKNPNHVVGEMTILKNNGTSMRNHVFEKPNGSISFDPVLVDDDAEFRNALITAFYQSNPVKVYALEKMFDEIKEEAKNSSAREFAIKFLDYMRNANLSDTFMLVMLFAWSFSGHNEIMNIYQRYGFIKPWLWIDGV